MIEEEVIVDRIQYYIGTGCARDLVLSSLVTENISVQLSTRILDQLISFGFVISEADNQLKWDYNK